MPSRLNSLQVGLERVDRLVNPRDQFHRLTVILFRVTELLDEKLDRLEPPIDGRRCAGR
jgi:hypothetical protein